MRSIWVPYKRRSVLYISGHSGICFEVLQLEVGHVLLSDMVAGKEMFESRTGSIGWGGVVSIALPWSTACQDVRVYW